MTDDDHNSEMEEGEYEVLMPLVTVQSKGGPHEDASYCAGAEMSQTDVELRIAAEINAVPCPRYVRTDNVPQIDLIAMQHHFIAEFNPWDEHPDEWTYVVFTNNRGITCVETDINEPGD